ncbi:MAG: aerotolerance regulator BatA [Bacteroidetes bacterium HGW-Bacteroidetes-21]|nr:MAG: aerotolerance regulator BatA [Bacteroidetes bacterium HGW-Bacteroidetes-21]
MEFAYPGFLFLLLVIPISVAWYVLRKKPSEPSLKYSTLAPFKISKKSGKGIFRHFLYGTRMLAIGLLIVALARPQSPNNWQDISTEGIDIMITNDISTSMLAEDFKPNRLEAGKDVAADFINDRPNDRIGLVVFSGRSFTQCPLTTDHESLLNLFRSVKTGLIEDGTAIGEGLATAVNRLKESDAKSKVVILLTDGVNNRGVIDPYTAAEIAQAFNIRVYTIGIGTKGKAPYPFQTAFGVQYQNIDVEIDEALLTAIANQTGGKYFRATDKNKLGDIYKEIDQLEKTKISVREYKRKDERYFPFLLAGAILALLDFLLRITFFRYIP